MEYPTSLNINVWTELGTLASIMSSYFVEKIIPSICTIFPQHPGATEPQSIMTPCPCWSSQERLHPFFSKHTFFGGGQKVRFWFRQSKHIVPNGFRLLKVFFCILQTLTFMLRSFFLATLPFRSLLFKVRCIVILSTARLVFATLFGSSFGVMCVSSSEHFSPG